MELPATWEGNVSTQNSNEFFAELKEWSERKLKILEKYLDPFVKILGSTRTGGQVYYVDAFAGAGIYEDGSLGSAIRAAELARQYRSENKSYQLECINVEADRQSFQNLQENTQKYEDLVLNLFGTFSENAEQILYQISDSPALFFLDPFGVKGINWRTLKRIIHRNAVTDLWIRFDHTAVRRLDGTFGSTHAGASKTFRILCDTYGIQDRAELHSLLSGQDAEARKQNAINLYTKRLSRELSAARNKGFAAAYPIRSIVEQDKYFLVFATGHPRGAIIASELVCGMEETYQRELEEYKATQPRQLSLFEKQKPTKEEIFQDKVTCLADDIWSLCRGQYLSRVEVYERILPKWFGKLRSKHITSALKKLLADNRIVKSTGAPSDRKTYFRFRAQK
jgi:three-Cys-motif partner protein